MESGRSGWYFRVIEPGEVRAGDWLERIATGAKDWSVARVLHALVAGLATRDELAGLARLGPLSAELRKKAVLRLGQTTI